MARKKADIPVYSFEKHSRLDHTTTIYSPHVLILEGIFALHDERVLNMLDLKVALSWILAYLLIDIICRFSVKRMQISACQEDVSTDAHTIVTAFKD